MIVVYKEMGVIVRYVLYGNRCPNVQDLQLSLKRNCTKNVLSHSYLCMLLGNSCGMGVKSKE